jgi:uncharacterized protein (UPF0332 family)
LATESDRYLAKAHESLASAEADLAAGRCNSAANRAYYAAFQAAVAALIREGLSPTRGWEHRFVSAELPLRLIHRRKALPSALAGVLNALFKLRIVADYRMKDAPRTRVERAVPRSREMVEAVTRWLSEFRVSDVELSYGGDMNTKTRAPREYVAEVERMIHSAYPNFRTVVIERGSRDYTLEVHGEDESVWEASDLTNDITTNMLVDDDVWIVVLPLDESWRNE